MMVYHEIPEYNSEKIISKNKIYWDRLNRTPRLGSSGKFYCGGKLETKCYCCDGNCGPTNGENCA